MKNLIIFSIIITGASIWFKKPVCEPYSFYFANKEWLFPSTVEEAVKKHSLNYKPPGYYYRVYPPGEEVILSYHSQANDFDNEYQPKETLYYRELDSYVFRYNEEPGLYDSLKVSLEHTYKNKFVLTQGMKDFGIFDFPLEKNFEYNFLTVNPCLTIGIIASPATKKTNRKVIVRFMYNLSVGQMGTALGNYL